MNDGISSNNSHTIVRPTLESKKCDCPDVASSSTSSFTVKSSSSKKISVLPAHDRASKGRPESVFCCTDNNVEKPKSSVCCTNNEDKSESATHYIDKSEENTDSIACYIDNSEDMSLNEADLIPLCVKELNAMSKEMVHSILRGDYEQLTGLEGKIDEPYNIKPECGTLEKQVAVANLTTGSKSALAKFCLLYYIINKNDSRLNAGCDASKNMYSAMLDQEIEIDKQLSLDLEMKESLQPQTKMQSIESVSFLENENDKDLDKDSNVSLEEGEVLSDQDVAPKLRKDIVSSQGCENKPRARSDTDSTSQTHSAASGFEDWNFVSNSINRAQKEKNLDVLELEFRARAIQALIKRNE